MTLRLLGWSLAGFLSLFPAQPDLPVTSPVTAQRVVKEFSLRGIDGKSHSLAGFSQAKGFIVVFTANICPFAKLYTGRLNDLNAKYKPLGVPLLAINSMDTVVYADETLEAMRARAKVAGFHFPYLKDELQDVARDFQAKRTPHAFVIWKENGKWVVKYSGAIDDNGVEPNKVTKPYLSHAVDALLKGKPVPEPETYSIGCNIYLRRTEAD